MSEAKLTNKELWRVFRHQLTIRGANNYERQQNAGFTEAMMPVIEKYYDDPEEKKEAYARHMEYFLTNDITSAIPVGVAAAMEERYARERDIDPDSINAVKTALMGPSDLGRPCKFLCKFWSGMVWTDFLCNRNGDCISWGSLSWGISGI